MSDSYFNAKGAVGSRGRIDSKEQVARFGGVYITGGRDWGTFVGGFHDETAGRRRGQWKLVGGSGSCGSAVRSRLGFGGKCERIARRKVDAGVGPGLRAGDGE